MFIAVSGGGIQIANGVEMPIVEGTVALLTPADFHQVRPGPQGLELLDVAFAAEELHDDVQELLLSTRGNGQIVVDGPDRDALIVDFVRLLTEQDGRCIGSGRIVQGALERILIEFCRHEPEDTANNGPRLPWGNVQRGIAYVHHHFREPLTLSTVAAHAGLSPHYFSEAFHRVTKTRFNAYLRDLRLHFAHSLLQVGELPVTDVCHASGFATLSHFERVFKAKYGVPPRTFRLTVGDGVL